MQKKEPPRRLSGVQNDHNPVHRGQTMGVERKIPFGKYKDRAISECPIEYLDWLIGQDWLRDDLKEDIQDYLESCPEWQRM